MDVEMKHKELTDQILNAFFRVYNTLGYGFLEKVYEKALVIELANFNLKTASQCPITVFYREQAIGEYFADLIVENKVIVELKAADELCAEHRCQLMNYLRATGIEVGLLLNFGKKPEFKRVVSTVSHKPVSAPAHTPSGASRA